MSIVYIVKERHIASVGLLAEGQKLRPHSDPPDLPDFSTPSGLSRPHTRQSMP